MFCCSAFTDRDCVTLVRPVVDEEELQELDKIPYDQLRDKFRTVRFLCVYVCDVFRVFVAVVVVDVSRYSTKMFYYNLTCVRSNCVV